MVRRRHGDPDIRVPVTGWALVGAVALVEAIGLALAGASGQVLAGAVVTVEESAGVVFILHVEAGSVMRSWSRDKVARILYATKKIIKKGGIHYARI